MRNDREILDSQLSGVTWTQEDRRAVRCAIGKEQKGHMKKRMLLAAALALVLMMSAAVAVQAGWGVLDFAQRDADVQRALPSSPVQTQIPQEGGAGREMTIAVTDAVWDGEKVYVTLLAKPMREGVLLMDQCLSPDMKVQNLDRELQEEMTIGQWAAAQGFTELLGLDVSPEVNGGFPACAVRWHLEPGGAVSLLIIFEGVTPQQALDVAFCCAAFGYDEKSDSFSDLENADSFRMRCTLNAPETE